MRHRRSTLRLAAIATLVVAWVAVWLTGSSQSFAAPEPGARPVAQFAAAPTPAPPVGRGPHVGRPIPPGSFEGDVRRLRRPQAPLQRRQTARPIVRTPTTPVTVPASSFDRARQAEVGARSPSVTLQQFAGLGYTGWYPPSANGDVGPSDYVQAVNIEIGIYDKTGDLLASFTYDQLFSSLGASAPCGSSENRGDVIVIYDPMVDRWIAADTANAGTVSSPQAPFDECIAVSKTGDPVSGGWYLYALPVTDGLLNDFAKLGVWSDGIYMSANMFSSDASTFENPRVWALNRDDMISGAAMRNVVFDVPSQYASLLPANLRGTTAPPTGEPESFAAIDEPSTFHLWKFHVDWSNQANSTFSGPTDLTVNSFAMPCNSANTLTCVPESGGERVDGLGDRLSMQLQYRNLGGVESLWANHSVAANENVGAQIGLRWYEIRDLNGTPTIYQQSTFQPSDGLYRWMGSLAVDQYGDMAIGYSVSSSSTYPAIRTTGRLATDGLNTLGQGETTVVQGTGSQVNGGNRWGDYTSMTIDPTDDCTFWYTNEYYASTGSGWLTWINSLQLYPFCDKHWPAPKYFYDFPVIGKNYTS